jgi:hypothetical protein
MHNFQAPETILMIQPASFGYNPETSASNAFQKQDDSDPAVIQASALKEFNDLVSKIRESGVRVVVIEDTAEPVTPDAIFPNNWISTHHDGTVVLYPMLAPSRRLERRSDILVTLQNDFHFNIQNIRDLTAYENSNVFLEGTGSIVFDYSNKKAYANYSLRTHWIAFSQVCDILDVEPMVFQAKDKNGLDIYHTNVVMCIGEQFAVICLDVVTDPDMKEKVRNELENSGHEVVEISYEQMTSFAGNMIELKNKDDQSVLVMSNAAFLSLKDNQKHILEKYASLVHSDLTTIEKYGGGSARCMITGIFLPELN